MLLYQIYHEHHSPVSGDKEGKMEKKKKKKGNWVKEEWSQTLVTNFCTS